MAEHQVLFCPFCRESFEGTNLCPEHELALVSFDQLAPEAVPDDDEEAPLDDASRADPRPPDERPLAAFDPRFGRGLVALGGLLNLLALALPLITVPGFETAKTHQIARAVPSLWTLLLVSFTVLFVLARRRTPRRLRGLRLLIPLLSGVSPLTLAWAIVRLSDGGTTAVRLGPAVYAVGAASLLLLLGGLRLGVWPAARDGDRRAAQ
jgi:hypothetical protein